MSDDAATIIIRLYPSKDKHFRSIVSIDPALTKEDVPPVLRAIANQMEKFDPKHPPVSVHTIEDV